MKERTSLIKRKTNETSPDMDKDGFSIEEGDCADDNADTVLSRLNAYHEQTSPLAQWYDSKGIFHIIDGDRDIDEITQDILKALK